MKLVRLSERCAVNPEEVASVTLPERGEFVCVTMRSGEQHAIEIAYGYGRWQALDRTVKAIEAGSE
ncbi:MAG: hypothetical protein EOS63_17425 [Mesorhizobium sp.]|uniref:hypothetical protein n=1 Tax=Mesorhizobium sp. TaxID=1871066 RepID=UPI000FE72A20|nr:hypothetical protein [Mesorhizobium sp.]RWE78535.1 MAG: hypothetical protein EOS63_17425 [Mesorhizobium sp.]TJW61015.1 MAG: hypothetical protein E5V97_22120 [Mesorhizobium sp.]